MSSKVRNWAESSQRVIDLNMSCKRQHLYSRGGAMDTCPMRCGTSHGNTMSAFSAD